MKKLSNRPRWLLLLFVFALVAAACAGDTGEQHHYQCRR